MPRKDFQRDLAKALEPGLFAHLDHVRPGDDDGSIYFTYTAPSDAQTIELQISVPDTSQYPKDHTYFAFAATDNIPEAVSTALEKFQPADCTLTVQEFLEYISERLDAAILDLNSQTDSFDGIDDEGDLDGETSLLSDEEMDWEDDDDVIFSAPRDPPIAMSELRSDLQIVKDSGYKIGYLGYLAGPVIISISCRIAKLGISYEAMKAWNVSPSDYLVLLIRYPQGYTRLGAILTKAPTGTSTIEMHVGACETYKPSLDEAQRVFNPSIDKRPSGDGEKAGNLRAELKPIFIGDSLRTLLNNHFVDLLGYRLNYGHTWRGAELFLNDSQGRMHDREGQEPLRPEYHVSENWDESTPAFLKADHVSDPGRSTFSLSFPLVAMQFTLRRFVKCVDFCLNCYCKLDNGFEALKPYVCSKGLCLYQYMKLGMGPSLEWEILSQPYVVDILISLAYVRASSGYLTDFPGGLGLKIPKMVGSQLPEGAYAGKLDVARMQLEVSEKVNLKPGDWIVLTQRDMPIMPTGTQAQWHCRVMSTVFAPVYELADPVRHPKSPKLELKPDVKFIVYDTDFDTLGDAHKRETICMLLDTLPNVDLIRSFLKSDRKGASEMSLATWTERISPPALYVLRWIVASNRSCIMHEENPEHRVFGVDGYMQFRLAQGAPDKEHRFVHAVRSVTDRLNLTYPTLFAWHGSPLYNWHSILREGLHFKHMAHGRAYGNGVYMSNSFQLSLGYSQRFSQSSWPNSLLRVSSAISLNEVVNAPKEFVQSQACYVVRQLEWIQPRYLFIQCQDSSKPSADVAPASAYYQDPQHRAIGPGTAAVVIPLSALSSRGMTTDRNSPKKKSGRARIKLSLLGKDNGDDDSNSVITLPEDRMLLEGDVEEALQKRCGEGDFDNGQRQDSSLLTDFRPGSLQEGSIKLLGQPQYATSRATRTLQQHLQATLKAQKKVPLHELGWYIDHNLVENVYQWIVELHSFEPSLPLAQDLKKVGLQSVVLELRFPPQFPMSPPFVRVIRPRFVMFSNGGGGHVTSGGALCMELLTTSGWSPVSSIESVLLQVRMAITSTDPQPARLDMHRRGDYSVGEAVEAYVRVCKAHNWQVPADLQRVSWT
ncbi:hypothetical protein P170DRAFT_431815 [Aspergillus steynii IBT 23096]|uniref:UBC core domain-containing protein n=1 Tax=Aspergillus steynii IBT 23096 TaxID=1392250 RepID=A0A2I2GMT6_9EURO|nr:uncharacterized protein P170DRAFT_431815 [Aspergillus steynii IBT 23096]PLB54186.1 hypothetical protein P170DRAFT_431815 [Aspergillus steynii IBT 23096]